MGLATARRPAVERPVRPGFPARRGAATPPGGTATSTPGSVTPRAVVRAAGPALVVALLGAVSALAVDRAGLAVLLLLVQCLPVVVRERFPVPALVLTTAGAVAQVLVGLPPSNAFLGQAVVLASLVRRMAWPWSVVPALLVLVANQLPVWAMGTPQAGRLAVIQATTFALAWTIGDAAARRAAVDRATEREIAEQHRTAELRTRLGAMAERLHIAQELHAVAGAGLRAILARAAVARRSVPEPHAAQAIETTGRQVLTELDRLLGLLRREPAEAAVTGVAEVGHPAGAPPAPAGPVGVAARFPAAQGYLSGLALVAPVVVVGVLTVLDGLGSWPGRGWLLGYAAAAALPLLARRRHPVVTTVAVTAASALPLAVGLPVADGPLGIVVAAHALASYRSRRAAVALGAAGVAVIVVLAMTMSVAYAVQLAALLPVFTAAGIYVGDTDRLARTHDAALAGRLREAREQVRLRERAAVAEERARAARDLHDSLGQALSLIVLQAGAVRLAVTTAAAEPHRATETLAAIETAARRALAELDAMLVAGGSAPAGPAATGPALDRLADDARGAGTPVTLTVGDLGDVPASLHTAVHRLVQESLTNVLKHAPGARADVVVDRQEATVRVRVSNSAGGAVPTTLPSGSRGLAGMRERVALFGGALTCGPQADGGFLVAATLPVPVTTPSQPAASGALS